MKEKILKEAYNTGLGDVYVEDILTEQAENYFNNEIVKGDDMTEKEYDELQEAVINAYRQGFYGAVSEDDIIKTYIK